MESNTLAPKNFFLQIGIVATLYISTISFLIFIFNIINNAYPTNLGYDYYGYPPYNPYSDGIRYSISVLIVMFPLFIWLSRIHRKNMEVEMGKESRLRKWLLFLTVFLTSTVMVVDLIVLINRFLGGNDLSTAFVLKVLTVFAVSALIFYFYLKDIKGYWNQNIKKAKVFGYVVCIVVLLSVVGGFFVIGSPAEARKRLEDSERITALQNIQWQILGYYQTKGALPQKLDDLKDPISGYIPATDPVTREPYEYIAGTNLSFKLCADFGTSSDTSNIIPSKAPLETYPSDPFVSGVWTHGAGHTCFDRTIDPLKYPVNKSNLRN